MCVSVCVLTRLPHRPARHGSLLCKQTAHMAAELHNRWAANLIIIILKIIGKVKVKINVDLYSALW